MESIWHHARDTHKAADTGDAVDKDFLIALEEIETVWKEICLICDFVGKIRKKARLLCVDAQLFFYAIARPAGLAHPIYGV